MHALCSELLFSHPKTKMQEGPWVKGCSELENTGLVGCVIAMQCQFHVQDMYYVM